MADQPLPNRETLLVQIKAQEQLIQEKETRINDEVAHIKQTLETDKKERENLDDGANNTWEDAIAAVKAQQAKLIKKLESIHPPTKEWHDRNIGQSEIHFLNLLQQHGMGDQKKENSKDEHGKE